MAYDDLYDEIVVVTDNKNHHSMAVRADFFENEERIIEKYINAMMLLLPNSGFERYHHDDYSFRYYRLYIGE